MSQSKMTFRQTLERLQSQGQISAEQLARAPEVLSTQSNTPLFIGLLVGVGAWLSGLFFTGSVVMLVEIMHVDKSGIVMMGIGYLFGATLLRRSAKHLFFIQAALALTVVGYLMVVLIDFWHHGGDHALNVAATSFLLSTILFLVNPCPIVRFMVPIASNSFVLFWLAEKHQYGFMAILILTQTLVVTWILLRQRTHPALRVLAHSLIFCLGMALSTLFYQAEHASSWHYWYYYDRAEATKLWLATSQILTVLLCVWLMFLVR
jgi:hypothetical protein